MPTPAQRYERMRQKDTGVAAGLPPGTVVVFDQFTAADNTAINGRTASPTPGASNWLLVPDGSTDMKITTNAAATSGSAGVGHRDAINSGRSDFTLTCDAKTGATSVQDLGVLICVDPTAVQLPIFINTDGTGWKIQVGLNVRGTYAVAPNTNQTYALKVIKAGNQIDFYLDGTLRISYTLTGAEIAGWASLTYHGLYAFGTTSWSLDNFKVIV